MITARNWNAQYETELLERDSRSYPPARNNVSLEPMSITVTTEVDFDEATRRVERFASAPKAVSFDKEDGHPGMAGKYSPETALGNPVLKA